MIGQLPNTWGIAGIALIVVGSYVLYSSELAKGLLAPFRAIIKERGSFYALVVAFIWSITSNLDKIAIDNSSTFSYLLIINIGVVVLLTVYLLWHQKHSFLQQTKQHFRLLSLTAFVGSVAVAFQMLAIQLILVPYVIALKRGGTVLGGILIGRYGFTEQQHTTSRMLGGIIMILGVLFILVLH